MLYGFEEDSSGEAAEGCSVSQERNQEALDTLWGPHVLSQGKGSARERKGHMWERFWRQGDGDQKCTSDGVRRAVAWDGMASATLHHRASWKRSLLGFLVFTGTSRVLKVLPSQSELSFTRCNDLIVRNIMEAQKYQI